MIDFHTHILPNMDDGAKDVSTSLELLNSLEKQNVKLVYLTSHFYPRRESIEDFLQRRSESFKLLNYKGNLTLKLGCEVHYYNGISQSDNLDKLCLEDTNILLLELPFETIINDMMIREIISLSNRGFRVMLAHIERYNVDEEKILYLKRNGVLIQSNCEFVIGGLFDHKGIKWLKRGYIDVIGTDCHNLDSRKPNYSEAINVIKDKISAEFCENFIESTSNLI